jgi:hypothetical protein
MVPLELTVVWVQRWPDFKLLFIAYDVRPPIFQKILEDHTKVLERGKLLRDSL